MNVVCPECKSVFRVDPAKVPEAGVRARCSVCGGIIGIGKAGTIDDDFAPPLRVKTPESVPALATRPRTPARTTAVADVATASGAPTPRPGTPPARPAAPPAWPAMPPRAGTPLRSAVVPPASAPLRSTTPGAAQSPAGASTPRKNEAPPPVSGEPLQRPRPMTGAGVTVPPPVRPSGEPRAPTGMIAPNAPSAAAGAGTSGLTRPVGGESVGAAQQAPSRPVPASGGATAPRPASAGAAPAGGLAARRPINPFLNNDPNIKARRLARALVSDLAAYYPDKRREGLAGGRLKELFKEEIKKSWEEYVDQVGKDFAENTSHFRDALNEILAGGAKVF